MGVSPGVVVSWWLSGFFLWWKNVIERAVRSDLVQAIDNFAALVELWSPDAKLVISDARSAPTERSSQFGLRLTN